MDELPPQEDEKVVVTSERFKKPEEPAPPLEELKSLVTKVGKSSCEKKEVVVVEEGEVTPEGTGDYPYASLGELLYNMKGSYPCPIHYSQMEKLKSKKEDCHDTFLRCQENSCPTFCNVKDHNYYYYGYREQGHSWFTLDSISHMVRECGLTPTLSMSKSDKSYGKMYLRFPQRNCDLFQWWRFKPSKKTQQFCALT